MLNQFRNMNFYSLLALDTILLSASLFMAYALRFSFSIPPDDFRNLVAVLPLVLAVKTACLFLTGSYRGMWRYTSLPDLLQLGKGALLGSLLIMAGLLLFTRFEGYPRSVFMADAIFTIFLCGGLRTGIRMLYARRWMVFGEAAGGDAVRGPLKRLLIVGAGAAAGVIIREIQGNPRSRLLAVACLDDDRNNNGLALLGVPVYGPISKMTELAASVKADEILIAMPSVTGSRMREIVALCGTAGVPYKTLPSISALVDGQVTINDLRPVNFEDLLGRAVVTLNSGEIGRYLTDKVVAVTGAGGSIGSELCRQIARFSPAAMILIDSNEFNLYRIEMELRARPGACELFPVMGRVQDRALMSRVLHMHRPQVLFHAAAYKHVPMVELNPWEGVNNNILGSQVMMDLAEETGVERFVQVSTDKAVRPTNVMGATKRMVEILLQTRKTKGTRFMAVRFGNVVGSSGSVIPLFQKQIQEGGPVTVTHPEMTRYFMTIPEASQLILQAGAMGEGGEIFILEMGTPVRIADMARDLIRLSGKTPGDDIEIVYTGLRPGEKLYEELITHGEGIVPTPHQKIMVLRRDSDPFSQALREWQAREGLKALIRAADAFDPVLIRQTLKRLIAEYVPSDAVSVLSDPVASISVFPVKASHGRERSGQRAVSETNPLPGFQGSREGLSGIPA